MPETALSTGNAGEGSGASQAGVTEQAQDKAKDAAGQAQEKAREAGEQVRGRVREQVDQRSTQAGEQIRDGAGEVRSFAQQLREQGKDKPAQYAEQAANRAERLGSYLDESDGERILHDVEDFGRRNPWAVVAGGVALGFMASRLLKASSTERYRSLPQRSGSSRGYGAAPLASGSSIGSGGATSSPPSQFEPHA
jgi:ElaB/YqjD/DUF883 family membrane-anchored ribosome-binding protein